MNKMNGFTLVELMVVLGIIAIISTVAYPAYQDNIRKANRADGMAMAMEVAQRLERCYTAYGAYNNANCPTGPIESSEKHYEINIVADASSFTVTADPVSARQLKDTQCASLSIDNTGKKSASGPKGLDCW